MIFTIGYEGAQLPDFLATLKRADVKLLVDVREVSVSRRKGFSKTALSQALAGVGIEYVHLRGLGDPKPGREAARQGNYKLFEAIYANHLGTAVAIREYERLCELAGSREVCLLCYERDPIHCHRSIVAKKASDALGLKVRHLGVQSIASDELIAAE